MFACLLVLDQQTALGTGSNIGTQRHAYDRLGGTGHQNPEPRVLSGATGIPAFGGASGLEP